MRHVLDYFLCLFTSAILVAGPGMRAHDQEHVTKINAKDLVTNGESFFELSNITSELTRLAPGTYCCEVQAGKSTSRSTLFVQ
jgi:hypothetical protein